MMPDFSALPFALASASCLLAAALLWLALALASRAWPVLAANRSVWLLSQAVIGGIFVLALMPQRASLSLTPPIAIERSAPPAQPQGALQADTGAHTGAHTGADTGADHDAPDADWWELAAQAWLALYCAGLLLAAGRWARAHRHLRILMASAHELDADALAAHAGFDMADTRGLRVFETEAAISPMLTGLVQARLLLPAHLRSFPPEQQRLIVAHELTHAARRDPPLLYASVLVQTLLWFNPVLRLLGEKLLWAQELGCDRAVLAGRPQQQRQHYAAALVAQLKLQQACFGQGAGAMAFGGAHGASIVARVGLIRRNGLPSLGRGARWALGASLLSLLGASALLQPALAWQAAPAQIQAAAQERAHASPAAAAGAAWSEPLGRVRVTSFYGAPRQTGRPHRGIDFAASKGSTVLAVGDGVVLASTDAYPEADVYGKVVVIEHANGLRSLYAHLERRDVQAGDRIQAGQAIGISGDSGRVTGPHLHLEAFDGERRIDPQLLLARLDAKATSRALRLRPAHPAF